MGSTLSRLARVQRAGLAAALVAAGSLISIPIPWSPVPLVLQNFFVILSGMILTPLWAAVSIFVYLLAGVLGLPVFAGATGGIAHFAAPSGGYLLSYLLVAPLVSVIAGSKRRILNLAVATVVGVLVTYLVGVPWLQRVLNVTMREALLFGFYPFLPGDAVKGIAAILLVRTIPDHLWQNLRSPTSP